MVTAADGVDELRTEGLLVVAAAGCIPLPTAAAEAEEAEEEEVVVVVVTCPVPVLLIKNPPLTGPVKAG